MMHAGMSGFIVCGRWAMIGAICDRKSTAAQ